MRLTDLASLERWHELEKDIHARSGMDSNVFDPQGYRISVQKNWANRLCPVIKATDKGQSFICAPAHMNIAAQARRSCQAVVEECDAGMIKLVVPIFLEDEFLGAVGACGKRFDDSEIDAFLVNKMTDIEEGEVEELAGTVPPLTRREAEELARHIQESIESIIAAFKARYTRLSKAKHKVCQPG